MSFRSKTLKAEKFGTPTIPTVTTPKEPSPKEPQIIKTIPQVVVTATKVSSKTHPRTAISFGVTPTQEGVKAQQSFTQKLYSVTVPIKNEIDRLKVSLIYYTSGQYQRDTKGSTGQHRDLMIGNITTSIHTKEKEIDTIVEDIINVELQSNVNQIIQAIESGKVLAPDYFHNNIAWVKDGSISQQEFLDAYYTLSHQGLIHAPEPEPTPEPIPEPTPEPIEVFEPIPEVFAEPDISITDNMVTQRLDSFSIINGRAIGQITFTATNSFNPYYYNKQIKNLIQFKTPNGVNILPSVKQNTLRFTATERTETITYNEGMNDNTRANVESFVWSGVTLPTPFSKSLKFEIVTAPTNGEPAPIPKVQTTGFMSAGVAGAIAGLILIGFIADHKRGK